MHIHRLIRTREVQVMDKIPNDILRLIYSFIPESDWPSILLTCKLWCDLGRIAFDPSIENNRAILWACRHGKVEAIKYLLKDTRVNPTVRNNIAIRQACENGKLGKVNLPGFFIHKS